MPRLWAVALGFVALGMLGLDLRGRRIYTSAGFLAPAGLFNYSLVSSLVVTVITITSMIV